MCDKCKESSCNGGCNSSSNNSDTQAQLDYLSEQLDSLTSLTRFLSGHPILALEDANDISQFDFTTGVGSGTWLGWSICNGSNYPSPLGAIATPDLRDRFLVGSQGSYAVSDTGGEATHVLVVTEIPAHNHGITDTGHTHVVTDPGHDHNVTDPGHTHANSATPHFHTFTTDSGGSHNHDYYDYSNETKDLDGVNSGGGVAFTQLAHGSGSGGSAWIGTHSLEYNQRTSFGSNPSTHSHTGNSDMATVAVTISTAFTGIDMDHAYTGITNVSNTTGITINDEGGNVAHENRPPYFALLFVKKIF